MKISKSRLQQIIKEEVEAHVQRENKSLEIDESSLATLFEKNEEVQELSEPSEDQLYTKNRDPETGERKQIPPKKNGIRVELKSC